MLGAFVRAFRTPDLRRKLLFTVGMMVVYRFGAAIPSPGVNFTAVRECVTSKQNDLSSGPLGMINLFSGGALLQLSVFALGIMPYITASIIVQLLTVVIPRFEALKQEGQSGTAKLTQYTRYLTMGLALLQSSTTVAIVKSGALFSTGGNAPAPGTVCAGDQILPNSGPWTIVLMVLTLTAGTGLIMWMGEQITERGIGNGMSILIFTSIAAGFLSALWQIKTVNDSKGRGLDTLLIVIAVGIVIMALVVFIEQAQRRIPVQYNKRMVGRSMYGGTSTYIPIKINQAGVIPVIFASSMLYIPALITQFQDRQNPQGWVLWIENNLTNGNHPLYMAIFFLLIIFFTYFYVAISFNPDEVADNMRKYGGFIQGIRAGRPTADYLAYVLSRITLPGAVYLGLISLIPLIAFTFITGSGANSQSFPFGGTSILIIVGVGLETVKQIQSQLQQRHYEGFLK